MIVSELAFIFFLSLIITLISILFLRSFAKKVGFVDKPSKRKDHLGNIPLIGGVSIFVGTFISIIGEFTDNNILFAYIISSFLILVVGLVDDYYPLSANVRIFIQIAIISSMIWVTELKFDTFGHSFGLNNQIKLGFFSYPITVLGIVFVTNAFNLMDGSDGVTGSLAILALIGINIDQLFSVKYNFNLLSIALLGSLIPYLYFNILKSIKYKIFLGDSGSLFLGYSVAFLLLYETQIENNISPPFALWIIAIPIFDVTSVIIYRLKVQSYLFAADKSHLHHFLQRLGLDNIKVLISIIGIAVSILILALLIEYQARLFSFPVFLCLLFGYVWLRVFSKYSHLTND